MQNQDQLTYCLSRYELQNKQFNHEDKKNKSTQPVLDWTSISKRVIDDVEKVFSNSVMDI